MFLLKKEIPPILNDNKVVSAVCTKANIFNIFFASACTAIMNLSVLPQFKYKQTTGLAHFLLFKTIFQ